VTDLVMEFLERALVFGRRKVGVRESKRNEHLISQSRMHECALSVSREVR